MKTGWTEATLADVASWSSGGTPRAGTPAFYGGAIPWAVIGDLTDGAVTETAQTITERGLEASSAKVVAPGTLLVAMYGSIGKLGIAEVPMATNQAIACAVVREHIEVRYLFHYLKSQRDALLNAGRGGTQNNISQAVLKAWPIPLPPLDEQRRIARILDWASAIEHRQIRSLSLFEDVLLSRFEQMFGNNGGGCQWDNVPVRRFVSAFSGGKSFAGGDEDDEGSANRVLRVSAVTSGRFLPEQSRPVPRAYIPPADHYVRRGDLLISRANTSELVGAVALVEAPPEGLLLPDKIWRFVWREPAAAAPEFIWQLFRTRPVRRAIERRSTGTSGSMKNISAEKLMGIEVIWPPSDLQHEFALFYDAVKRLSGLSRLRLTEIQDLGAVLESRAFSGGL